MPFSVPNIAEQSELAEFFASLDDLIALHQRKP
jgi:restriction endonuclease S subunit